jgi:hypothetical protein
MQVELAVQGRIGGVAMEPIYVEILIDADMDRIWELTQDTNAHPRWDLRFSSITPTETTSDGLVVCRVGACSVVSKVGSSSRAWMRVDDQQASWPSRLVG